MAGTDSSRPGCCTSANTGRGCCWQGRHASSKAMRRRRTKPGAAQPSPPLPDHLAGAKVIVDAMFGAGLDRPVEGHPRAVIEAMNATGYRLSRLICQAALAATPARFCGVAVRARTTVTFFRRKPGHVLLPGRLHCGEVRVVDIGIAGEVLARIRPMHLCQCARLVASSGSRCLASTATSIPAGTRSWFRAAPRSRARRGSPHAAHCGPVPASSPLRRRGMRSRSTPPANLAVMVRAVDGARELAALPWPTIGSTRWRSGRAVVLVPRPATWCSPPWPVSGLSCSMPTR